MKDEESVNFTCFGGADSIEELCASFLKDQPEPIWLDYSSQKEAPWWDEFYRWQAPPCKFGMWIRVRTRFPFFPTSVYFFPHQDVNRALDALFATLTIPGKHDQRVPEEPIFERKPGENFYSLAEDQNPQA